MAHIISPFLQVRRYEKHLYPKEVGDTVGDVQPSQQEVKKRRPILLSYTPTSCYGQKPQVTQPVLSRGRRQQKVPVEGIGRWRELAREAARPAPGRVPPGTGRVPGLSTHPPVN